MRTSAAAVGVVVARSEKRPAASIAVGFGTGFGWLETRVWGPTPPVMVKVTGELATTRIAVGDTDSATGVMVTVPVTVEPVASRTVSVTVVADATLASGVTVKRPLTSMIGLG